MASKDFSVRIGREEIGRILNLKENLDFKELLVAHARHYQELGWSLVGMQSPEGKPLALDLSQPADLWIRQFSEMGADESQINIGIRTGQISHMLVLEVNRGEGALALDHYGEWRAACVAAMGETREQHYYAVPPETHMPPSFFQAPQVLIYGEGGLVLVPPSLEPQAREPWHWLQPPWESLPQPPPPAVWQFLTEHIPPALAKPQIPTWAEVYQTIAPHGSLLKALLVPPVSQEVYYQGIVTTAMGVGVKDPTLLLGLLWHAPHGEAKGNPEKRGYFEELITTAQRKPAEATPVAGLPAMLTVGNALQAPGSPPPAADPPSAMTFLDLFSGSGLAEPAAPEKEGAASPRFDQSVSGQFFQLLAGLGEKVIMESCRYEAMLAGVKGQAGEIDNLLTQWEQYFTGQAPNPGDPEAKSGDGTVEFGWDNLVSQNSYKKQQFREIQAAASDFLAQNPDLAGDQHKVQMVVFCLKNYISINPEYGALSFREKLDRAGVMARGYFLSRSET